MFCKKCQDEVDPVFTKCGPHIKASCLRCGAYIKFVPKSTFGVGMSGDDVVVDTDDVCEVRLF